MQNITNPWLVPFMSYTKSMDHPPNKEQAQHRIGRINAFQKEMATLKSEGILELSQENQSSVSNYHSRLIDKFSSRFDTDTTSTEKKLSWGMRVLTFLGGFALCVSVFFFFYRFWGLIPTWAQIGIVITAPLLALLGMKFAANKEKTFYYATLAALFWWVSLTCLNTGNTVISPGFIIW